MGRDASGAGARWQGYSHQELYDMLHSGPGSGAAGAVADTWSGMSGALSDIQQDINQGVTASGATWVGTAADSARGALGPLGDWAQQASTAADVMRASVELQGDLLGKARSDMPAPVAMPQQNQIGQLVTSQIDYEVTEMASQVAAQQAFQVMAQYDAATTDNMSSLGEFSEPPKLVVDTAPVTGVAVRRSSGIVEPSRAPSFRSRSSFRSKAGDVPADSTSSSSESSEKAVDRTAATNVEETSGSTEHVITVAPEEMTPVSAAAPTSPEGSSARSFAGPEEVAGSPVIGEPSTTPSSTPSSTTPSSAQVTPSAASPRSRKASGSSSAVVPQSADRFSGPAVVPAARRPGEEHEPDDAVHESKYLIEADDIYGAGQLYSPPVIGESRPRR